MSKVEVNIGLEVITLASPALAFMGCLNSIYLIIDLTVRIARNPCRMVRRSMAQQWVVQRQGVCEYLFRKLQKSDQAQSMYSFIHYEMCYCTERRGYILSFSRVVVLIRPALAAVIRAMRSAQGLTQENLGQAASRTYMGKIENATSSPSLDKFVELAEALEVSPVALMALVLATRNNTSASDVLESAAQQLQVLLEKISPDEIAAHLHGSEVLKRPAARPADLTKLKNVLLCKDAGMSQADTARKLGLSRSTVSFLWKRSTSES